MSLKIGVDKIEHDDGSWYWYVVMDIEHDFNRITLKCNYEIAELYACLLSRCAEQVRLSNEGKDDDE